MYRLTTPNQKITLPDDINPSTITWLRWSYSQYGKIVIEKRLADVEQTENGFEFHLSQEETKLFKGGDFVLVQVRFGIGSMAYTSAVKKIMVDEVLNDSVIRED